MSIDYHRPVLLKETLEYLDIKPGNVYIDATLGGGGHTFAILQRGGKVLGIDTDQDAVTHVEKEVKSQKSKVKIGNDLILAKGNFRDIGRIAHSHKLEKVNGILFDVGVSSYQLDTPERGFSFKYEAPLDMRMDQDLGVSAADLLAILTKGELYELFTKYGEEPHARTIADRIVRTRGIDPITTTKQLSELIRGKYPRIEGRIDPSTKIFQALRIAVNDELDSLRQALPQALDLLEGKGRLVVISFHSLEDRIVKQTYKVFEEKNLGHMLTAKPVVATSQEVENNSRARSAKLRAFEKI